MMFDDDSRARFAITEWTDRGDEMSAEEFRRCMEIVLAYSNDEATIIFDGANSEQRSALPATLIPNGCIERMVRTIEESRALEADLDRTKNNNRKGKTAIRKKRIE